MVPVLVVKDVVVCGDLAETLATVDLVEPEVRVVGEGADDLVSPVFVDAAVVPEWVSVAVAAVALFVVLAFMMDERFFLFWSFFLAWAVKAEYLLFKSKQKSCKLFIAINRPKS